MSNFNQKYPSKFDAEQNPLIKKISLKKESDYEGGATEPQLDNDKKKDYCWAWGLGITGIIVIIILVIVVFLVPGEDQ